MSISLEDVLSLARGWSLVQIYPNDKLCHCGVAFLSHVWLWGEGKSLYVCMCELFYLMSVIYTH
jgi:hypothetical protein